MTSRTARAEETYARLFGGPRDSSVPEDDPELMEILRRFIFGEVFATGDLDDRTRELITVVVLATNQTLPQLTAHAHAALNVGVSPVELREALYLCAPFLGFPRTLTALGCVNEVFRARGVTLPLPDQGATSEDDRHARGLAIQDPLYGDEIATALAALPDGLGDELSRMLTEVCFGDLYTRSGMDTRTRELLVLCLLAALGDTHAQVVAHSRGNLRAGNDHATQIAALIHCFPYTGFPRTINAIRAVQKAVSAAGQDGSDQQGSAQKGSAQAE